MRVYISVPARYRAGGSKTFATLFASFLTRRGHSVTRFPWRAQAIVVIAHHGNLRAIQKAKGRGCRVLHRVDEHIEPQAPGRQPDRDTIARSAKHEKLKAMNAVADVTVFQSRFVLENMGPFLQPSRWHIIHNGTNCEVFKPADSPGRYIGHASWSVHRKKRLDLLHRFILDHPEESFLLAGNHKDSEHDFALPNVTLLGPLENAKMDAFYRQLKLLYFPSENDPCPNTVVEALASGVPVCFNPLGGSRELVGGPDGTAHCGEPLEHAETLLSGLPEYRARCLTRTDLQFDAVAEKYLALLEGRDLP